MGAGLPAMQATRSDRCTEVMPSLASQLPQELRTPANGTGLNRRQAGTMPTPFLLRPCHD
ncbi:hypothetical protein FE275_25930 [Pseudomonas koreensis]|nr:hypothetical protein FE275_25930 [Pseudomonas koreensis]